MRWERGRQSGGYEKLRLFEIPQRIDGWLIRYVREPAAMLIGIPSLAAGTIGSTSS